MRPGTWLARLLPDFGPARDHPAYRRLLAGGQLSMLGGAMTSFAVVLQVWDLTRSSLAVGLLGLTFVPVLVVGLLGMPMALFPALNAAHFGGSPRTLGLLNAAVGAGRGG